MRRYRRMAAVIAIAMMLTAGCSDGSSSSTTVEMLGKGKVQPTEATTAAPEKDWQGLAALQQTVESMEARIDDLEEEIDTLQEMIQTSGGTGTPAQGASDIPGTQTEQGTLTIPYSVLITMSPDYLSSEVTYSGRVLQFATMGENAVQLLIAVDGDETMQMVGDYPTSVFEETLQNGDIITITGKYTGVMRYMVGGGERMTLPTVKISSIVRGRLAASAGTEESEEETTEAEETEPETTAAATLPQGPLGPLAPSTEAPLGPAAPR